MHLVLSLKVEVIGLVIDLYKISDVFCGDLIGAGIHASVVAPVIHPYSDHIVLVPMNGRIGQGDPVYPGPSLIAVLQGTEMFSILADDFAIQKNFVPVVNFSQRDFELGIGIGSGL